MAGVVSFWIAHHSIDLRGVGAADVTEADVREDDGGIRRVGLDVIRSTRVSAASTTSDTGLGSIFVEGVVTVEPGERDKRTVLEGEITILTRAC